VVRREIEELCGLEEDEVEPVGARRERRQRWPSVLGAEESRVGVVDLDVGAYGAGDGNVDSWRKRVEGRRTKAVAMRAKRGRAGRGRRG
jgi:hypothetical protein